jgi:hypothetical protein
LLLKLTKRGSNAIRTTAIFLAAMATTVQAGQISITVDFNAPDPSLCGLASIPNGYSFFFGDGSQ